MAQPRIQYGSPEYLALNPYDDWATKITSFRRAYEETLKHPEKETPMSKNLGNLRSQYPGETESELLLALYSTDMSSTIPNPQTFLDANAVGRQGLLQSVVMSTKDTGLNRALGGEIEENSAQVELISTRNVCAMISGENIIDMRTKLKDIPDIKLTVTGMEDATLGDLCRVAGTTNVIDKKYSER